MNGSMIAAVITSAAALISILGCVFVGGKLTRTVEDHTNDIAAHAAEIKEHRLRIAEHDIDLAKIQQWRDGFNLGAQITGQDGRK